ncbi:LysR family transcriptional regulator [Anaerocolumna jejuensis]|uniref:LysR family transcriptional regulator n=1 Tax=Anaerocolumna jejuensis TaxID=259063 RepID=UPI003F7CC595
MDIKHLRYFEVVYEEKSINSAAKKLFISPQGLGRILRGLEEEFHTTFFIRTHQGLVPNESGKIFYEQSKKITKEQQFMKDKIQKISCQDQIIRIGFANGVLKAISLDIVFQFMERYPDACVEWCEYENNLLIEKILALEVDYGLVVGKTQNESLFQKLMHSNNVVLLVYEGHSLYEKEYITLDMLKHEKLLVMNEQFRIYHDFVRACKAEGFIPDIKVKTMDGSTLYHLCSKKLGLAITPDFLGNQYYNVKPIPFRWDYTWNIYGTCLHEKKNMELIRSANAYFEAKE